MCRRKKETNEGNYGLMGICCEEGNNQTFATYQTRGWTLGVACSLACLMIWLIVEFAYRKRKQ